MSAGRHPWRRWPASHRTVQHILTGNADAAGGKLALTVGEQRFTARDLVDRAARTAATLRAHGAGPGDRVVVVSPNRAELIDLFHGSAWNGSVLVPLNPELRGDPLRHQLRLADPAIVLVDASTAAQVAAVAPAATRLVFDTPALDGPRDSGVGQQVWADAARFALAPEGIPAEAIGPETTAAVLFTSGTTGPAKGVVMPHGQFWWWSVIGCEQLALDADDVLYTALPLFHTNALTTPLQAFAAGGRAVIGPRFSVSAFWTRLEQAQATTTFILGAMSTMLWNRRPETFDRTRTSRLRRILGPGIAPAIKREFEDFFGVHVVEGFGMTEIGVPIYTPPGERTSGVAGIPHPDFEVALLGPGDVILDGPATGELAVRPRQPFQIADGYLGNPEATLEARRNLWFHTGDLVERDARGYYRWRDRLKDSIRRRGENISSYEIEAAFRVHPAVADAAAIAVPSPLGEDEVLVCLHLADGAEFDPAALLATASEHLPAYALPSYLRVVDAFPLTANGKVAKQVLREQGVTEDTWERG
ncbi:AMP-binding protein [Amycolatopsis magusensis]|uniref:Crotonobetaine/carnitine-CoA ligase n=1 Tax=Amycolatopsis magusensis TaxID=882444 RepID=A0ABS4PYF0_9PSEU|nr:AMP-binding protein [Amycolatopsis magusensis]MBP2184467.1 crotonobetaine/carnitine-CoA ligase [Amycolatopsis magusensis]